MQLQQRITPFLSYMDRAEEAAEFYVSVLPNSKILHKLDHPTSGAVLTVEFELCGMRFVALNTGQDWKFTTAISLAVACDTQEEIDMLWTGLTADGGSEVDCGWLQDKFGVSWQIVPSQVNDWLSSGKSENIRRMLEALWQMKKLDVVRLQAAFEGNGDGH